MKKEEVKKKKQKFYKTDIDKVQQRLASIGSGKFFKPSEGRNMVRILPPTTDSGLFYKESTLHYGLRDDSGKERGYICHGKDCPVCEKIRELSKQGKEGEKVAKRIGARTKFYVNLYDRKTEKVYIWGFSRQILGKILGYITDEDFQNPKGECPVTDLELGHDLVIERTGTKLNTKYEIRLRPRASSIEDLELNPYDLENDVDDDTPIDELEEIVESNFSSGSDKKHRDDEDEEDNDSEEESDEEEEEEDEEETPKKKKAKKDEDEEEEEEEDNDEEGDEEEEEEEPKKKKKSKDEDDEDEDEEEEDDDEEESEDEEDEEEDEEPVKKKTHTRKKHSRK